MRQRITKKLIEKRIDIALNNIEARMRADYDSGSQFARGLASEGYNGGYRDALSDVDTLLRGMLPSRNGWWKEKEAGDEQ